MRILGLDINWAEPAIETRAQPANAVAVGDRGSWWHSVIREPFTGAWQRNMEASQETILAFAAVYSCVSLIASDIGKLRMMLVEQGSDDIWSETTSPAFSPVLTKPNEWQNRIEFFEQWLISKLTHGNTYVLKARDARRIVTAMYILDPTRTKPLVTPSGEVYYQVGHDDLSGITEDSTVIPATEIIHDKMPALYHPLVGISPLRACLLGASHGLSIQQQSRRLFRNNSRPGGVLSAPGQIAPETAARLKVEWEDNFTGDNAGRVAVLGDGLQYSTMVMTAVDQQLIEQLNWTERNVCTAFRVPPYKVNVGPSPTYNNIEALDTQYYAQCLQTLIEKIELCLDEGLGLTTSPGHIYGTMFDLDDLLRMDMATKVTTYGQAVGHGMFSPDEARRKFDLKAVPGGSIPYLQQQNFSLEALAKRDVKADPFAPPGGGDTGDSGNLPPTVKLLLSRGEEPREEPRRIRYEPPPVPDGLRGAILRDELRKYPPNQAAA